MSGLPESKSFSYDLQVTYIEHYDRDAVGNLAGTPSLGLPTVEVFKADHTPIEGNKDIKVTEITFGLGHYGPGGSSVIELYSIADLNLIAPKAAFDSGNLSWLTVSLAGNDSVHGGYSKADYIKGGNGNDTLEGGGGTARDDTGDDTLDGGSGNDRLVAARTGNKETLDGGSGNDTAFFEGRPTEYTFSARAGGGVIVTDKYEFAGVAKDVVLNVETFEFQSGDSLTQADLFNPAKIYAGNDLVTGSSSNNILRSYGGNDTLKGYAGEDRLYGGDGNDYLYGGLENDKLYGGTGRDQFVFDMKPTIENVPLGISANKDAIYDFNVKDDTIRLDNAVFTKVGVNGYLKSSAFWTNNTGKAHDRNDRIIYDKDSGVLYYDPDGTGSGKAVAFTTISKNLWMTFKDIYVM
jgi:serralysin